MKYYVFAKFFKHLSVSQLMEQCAEIGVDGPTALIRDEYWITESTIESNLKEFIRIADEHRLEVRYADTPYSLEQLAKDSTPLKIMADYGIQAVRLAYEPKKASKEIRTLPTTIRRLTEKVAKLAELNGIKAVIQVHGGAYPHNATAAYPLVADLNPDAIGIKIDPGNNHNQEGYEHFDYQFALLNEYIAGIGMKDACALRTGDVTDDRKGWKRVFTPAFDGETNWFEIYSLIKHYHMTGPLVCMPFYHEDDFNKMLTTFKEELAYFKKMEARVFKGESDENK
jgi:sugar phosphate isomerase/epimerase